MKTFPGIMVNSGRHPVWLIISVLITTNNLADAKSKKPHVILIVADDIGWNDVSWHNSYVVTPNLDNLARAGIILNQSYVQPMCTPTRTALMTGRYPFTLGLQKDTIKAMDPRGVPLSAMMLPQVLKEQGYSTHAIGKWHLGFCSWDYTPTKRGFDSFYGFYTASEDYYNHTKSESLERKNKYSSVGLDLRNNTDPDTTKAGVYSTELFASVAEDLVRSRNSKDPMFLYLAFQSAHEPLQVPQQYLHYYNSYTNTERKTYLAVVTAMDVAVGRLVRALKQTGHYKNSIIIFTTDNGGPTTHGASNWPLRGGKVNFWEGGTRGSSFVHSPLLENKRGTVSNQLIHATDWFPTIVGVTGGDIPEKLDGYNQWGALAGLESPPRSTMVYNIDNTDNKFKASIRINDFKMCVEIMGPLGWVSPMERRGKNGNIDSESLDATDYPMSDDDDYELTLNSTTSEPRNRERLSHDTYRPISTEDGYELALNSKGESRNGRRIYPSRIKVANKLLQMAGLRSFITWEDLKKHPLVPLDKEVIKALNPYMRKKRIRLFNVKDDPLERKDLTPTGNIKELAPLLTYLSQQMPRYIQDDYGKVDPNADPSKWNYIWSPGWCTAS